MVADQGKMLLMTGEYFFRVINEGIFYLSPDHMIHHDGLVIEAICHDYCCARVGRISRAAIAHFGCSKRWVMKSMCQRGNDDVTRSRYQLFLRPLNTSITPELGLYFLKGFELIFIVEGRGWACCKT